MESRKGTIRGVFTAFVVMFFLTFAVHAQYDVAKLAAHEIAMMSISVWAFSGAIGFLVYVIINPSVLSGGKRRKR